MSYHQEYIEKTLDMLDKFIEKCEDDVKYFLSASHKGPFKEMIREMKDTRNQIKNCLK